MPEQRFVGDIVDQPDPEITPETGIDLSEYSQKWAESVEERIEALQASGGASSSQESRLLNRRFYK